MATQESTAPSEREVKLAAAPSFRTPSLEGFADGTTPVPREPYAELHDIRIRTKRVRYAAEAIAPLVGRQARAFARAAAALQEELGDLNDAVVAERWLQSWARGSRSMPGVFAAGELAGLERASAGQHRSRWRNAWKELSSPKLRTWM